MHSFFTQWGSLKTVIVALFIAFLIRLLLAFFGSSYTQHVDLLRYKDWARIAVVYSLSDTYKLDHITFGNTANNQPPGTLYILRSSFDAHLLTARIVSRVFSIPLQSSFINDTLLHLILKIPSIITDLLTGTIIYLLIKKQRKQNYALFGSMMYLFNPVIIYNSAVIGQTDSLNNFLFMASLLALSYKRYLLTILLCALCLYIKISLLILLPLYLLILLFQGARPLKLLLASLISFILVLVVTLPFSVNPLMWIITFFQTHSGGEMQNISIMAFNFWWVLFFSHLETLNPLSSALFLGLSLSMWGIMLFGLTLIPFVSYLWRERKRLTFHEISFLLAVTALSAFLFLPRMHERYMYPFFPLFAVTLGFSQKYLWVYWVLIGINLCNLYVSWHPIPFLLFAESFLYNPFFQWGLCLTTLILFFYVWGDIVLKLFNGKRLPESKT